VPEDSVIIQACKAGNKAIPHFCYHERLAIAGNCRMCLVQVDKFPKLVASCSQPVQPGMRIITDSEIVKKAREGVMEFLLANHPLDCAICDQGGECDLQDQSMAFGTDSSRFIEPEKRAVVDKNFGPLIKTSMNRCIHCTRCVRFANEFGGLPNLGTTGRGNHMEIGTYVDQMLNSELSGNLIDLCPVGALTSKPYAFKARPWELRKTESIDVMDPVCSSIRIDSRGLEILRVLPRPNDAVNEEWLADKSRFACDGLNRQRIVEPLNYNSKTGTFDKIEWIEALKIFSEKMKEAKGDMEAIVGPFCDLEMMTAVRDLFASQNRLDSLFIERTSIEEKINSSTQVNLLAEHSSLFRSNVNLQNLEKADVVLLVGSNNIRHEVPLYASRIRKAYLKNDDFLAGTIGIAPETDLNFEYINLGDSFDSLKDFVNNLEKSDFGKKLKTALRPIVIFSLSLLQEYKSDIDLIYLIGRLVEQMKSNLINSEWNGLCVIPTVNLKH
jgi:NADH dehydrogenase (ubiquinone) Fe-S protein 1